MDRLFNQTKLRTIFVGKDARLRLLSAELAAARIPVTQIRLEDLTAARSENPPGVSAFDAAADSAFVLAQANAETAHCLVAATADDDRNLSLCRLGHDKFQIPIVISRLRMFEHVTSWARLNDGGMVRMNWPETARTILGDVTPSASLSRLLTATDHDQITDIKVLSPVFVGRRIAQLPLGACGALGLTRREIPLADFNAEELCLDDVLTLMGSKEAVNRVCELFTSL